MSRFAVALILTVLVPLPLVAGCKADPACEPMRRELAKAWGTLRESAMKRKLSGVDVEGWAKVEDRAALVESSFATPQVTWQSAERARSELTEMLKGRQTDTPANLTGYMLSLDAANKLQAEFTRRCQ